MRWGWVLAAVACKGTASDVGPAPGPIEAEVLDYDYAFDVATGQATSTLTLRARSEGDCVRLDYAAPEPLACRMSDAPATCDVADGEVEVCGEPVAAGLFTVSVDLVVPEQTYGDTDVGYHTLPGGEHYLVSWVSGCSQFGPCDADPGTFATYRFTVDHEPGATLLCAGELEPGDTRSTCTFDLDGGPTYSTFGFAVSSRWTRRDLGTLAGIEVQFYDLPSPQSSLVDLDAIDATLRFLQDNVGPYPYGDTLRFFAIDSYWAGFEHPGNVSVSSRVAPGASSWFDDRLRSVMTHEIVHMWAGNQTTLATARDFAWKEATAQYVSQLVTGEPREPAYWKAIARRPDYYPFPEEEGLHPFDWYGDAYGPGPMVVYRQLEAMFGREAVIGALPGFLGAPGTAGVDDVREALEASIGEDLTDYFDTWAIGSGAPEWPAITLDLVGSELTVTQQTSDGLAWPCAFHVRVVDAVGGEHDVRVVFPLGGDDLAVTVTLDAIDDPVSLVLDPFSEALVY